MDGEPLLDLSILDRLRDWGGADLKHQMIELFFENAPERVEESGKVWRMEIWSWPSAQPTPSSRRRRTSRRRP